MIRQPAPDGGPEGGFAAQLRSADGLHLRAVFWPHPSPKGRVLIFSGRSEYAGKFTRLAAVLHEAGFASATIDWRGQGLSERLLKDPRRGHVTAFSDYQLDLQALLAALPAAGLAQGPLFVVSHSMGGAIALRALLNGLPARAAAFSAPMWGIQTPMPQNRVTLGLLSLAVKAGLGRLYAPPPGTGPLCPAESLPFALNPLTSDPDEWAAQQSDLRAHPGLVIAGPTCAWSDAAFRECAALAALPSPALPCLIGLGSDERIVCTGAIRARLARWPGAELLTLPGAQHEILMEKPAHRRAFSEKVIALFTAACA